MALRSSLHRVKSRGRRTKIARAAGVPAGEALPAELTEQTFLEYDLARYDLRSHVIRILSRCGSKLGTFARAGAGLNESRGEVAAADACLVQGAAAAAARAAAAGGETTRTAAELELYQLDETAYRSKEKQELLTQAVLDDAEFLAAFEKLVVEVAIPHMKRRLVESDSLRFDRELCFFYQRPPTLRLQRGPSERYVPRHSDQQYGHQEGELNFWLPLSRLDLTKTTLEAESAPGKGDFAPLDVDLGSIAVFHGTLCRHGVPANRSRFTRVSLDFRIGVEGCFDPEWVFAGTRADHARRKHLL